jgi:molecular chaperone GrpE
MSEAKPDIPPEVEEKISELTILQQAVEEAKVKAADYYDQLLRLKAEFENFRRRTEREKSDARQWGKQDVLIPLLQLVDVFEQALHQTKAATDPKQVVQGLEFLHKSFSSFLKTEGLEAIETVGQPLNPELAEAVDQVAVDPEAVGKVIRELQKGYRFQGRVLRPARVQVGVARDSDTGSNAE